jgi:hypothetical protein
LRYTGGMLDKLIFLLTFAICFGIGGALVWLVVR